MSNPFMAKFDINENTNDKIKVKTNAVIIQLILLFFFDFGDSFESLSLANIIPPKINKVGKVVGKFYVLGPAEFLYLSL